MLKKVFASLATVLLAVVVMAAIGIILAPCFGWRLDVVTSGSMEPALKDRVRHVATTELFNSSRGL